MKTAFNLLLACFLPILACRAQQTQPQDDAGGVVKVTTTLRDDGTKTVTKTDLAQHTSEAATYDAKEKLQQKIVYTIDDQGQPMSGIVYGANGKPALRCVYKRDGMARVTEEIDYTLDGNLLRRFTYDFGANGRVIRVHAFDASGNELEPADGGSRGRKDVRKSAPFRHQ